MQGGWVGGEGGVLGALIFTLLLCLLNLGIYMYSTCMLRVQAFELTWELFFGMKGGWEGNMHHFCTLLQTCGLCGGIPF